MSHGPGEHERALLLFGECPTCAVAAERAAAPPPALPSPKPDPDGATYRADLDRPRLGRQAQDVWNLMIDGEWRTLRGIADATGHPEASVSARLRDFRKVPWGGHEVEAEREPSLLGDGTWRYRLVPRTRPDA